MPPKQSTLIIGTILRERYLVKNVLGSGTNGAVYLVKDTQVKRLKYNLFILKEITGLDDHERSQFIFTGVGLRQLQHPALPRIRHVFHDNRHNCVYLVLDYVEGLSLEQLRQQQPEKRFSWSELKSLLAPVVEALIYLHQQETPIFHGDLKPANVIQSETGKMLLVGPGYAQATLSAHPHRAMPSSYRAPEYLPGKIDEFADIYGLGATIYTLLTGQPPLDALARMKLMGQDKPDPLEPANSLAAEVPAALAEKLQGALALDPDERFSSVQDFWQALNALSSTTPMTVAAVSKPEPVSQEAVSPVTAIVSTKVTSDATGQSDLLSSTSIASSAGASTQHNTFLQKKKNSGGATLLKVAIICAILLLLISAGAGFWASIHTQASIASSSVLQGSTLTSGQTPVAATSVPTQPAGHLPAVTPTPIATNYPHMLGSYAGLLSPLGSSTGNLSLIIKQQHQSLISGTFAAPHQKGNFAGTVDAAGAIQFTVKNGSGVTVYTFSGGLNGSPQLTDSMGGTFYRCSSTSSSSCQAGSSLSGTWTLNHQP